MLRCGNVKKYPGLDWPDDKRAGFMDLRAYLTIRQESFNLSLQFLAINNSDKPIIYR